MNRAIRLNLRRDDGLLRARSVLLFGLVATTLQGANAQSGRPVKTPNSPRIKTGGSLPNSPVNTKPRGPELVVQSGHTGTIEAVAFSPDGRFVATEGGDGSTVLWEAQGGIQLRRVPRAQWRGFSQDGRYAQIREGDFTVMHDLLTWSERERVRGDAAAAATALQGKVAGRAVRFETSLRDVRQIDVVSKQETRRYAGQGDDLRHLLTTPDGRFWLIADAGAIAHLWDVVACRVVASFDELATDGDGRAGALAIAPDGRTIATGHTDGTVRLWETKTGQAISTLQGHEGAALCLSFSPDGQKLVSAAKDDTLRLWNVATSKEIAKLTGLITETVVEEAAVETPATGTAEKTPEATAQGKAADKPTENPDKTSAPAAKNDAPAANEAADNKVAPPNASPKKTTDIKIDLLDDVSAVAFSPDGAQVATVSNGLFTLWDVAAGREVRHWRESGAGAGHSLQFSPDGRLLLSGDRDNAARLWNTENGEKVRELRGHSAAVETAVFAPSGQTILTASVDGTSRLWETESGKEVRHFEGFGWMWSAQFYDGGRFVLTASDDGLVRVWRTADGQPLAGLIVFRKGSWAVIDPVGHYDTSEGGVSRNLHWAISGATKPLADFRDAYYVPELLPRVLGMKPNGAPLPTLQASFARAGAHFFPGGATGVQPGFTDSGDAEEGIVSLRHLRLMAHLGHGRNVTQTRLSPDGKYLLTSGQDWTALLWETATGLEVCRFFYGRPASSNWTALDAVDFRADSGYLTIAAQGITHFWDLAKLREVRLPGLAGLTGTLTVARDSRYALNVTGGEARLLEIGTGKELWKRAASCAAFSPDSRTVVIGDGLTGKLFRAEDGQETGRLSGSVAPVKSLLASPDSRFLLMNYSNAAGQDLFRLWDTDTGRSVANLPGAVATYAVPGARAEFSPDSRTLLIPDAGDTGGEAGFALYDCAIGSRRVRWSGRGKAFFSRDSRLVALCGPEGQIRLCDVANGQEKTKFTPPAPVPDEVEIAPGGRFALLRASGGLHLWDIAAAREVDLQTPLVHSAVFTPDGRAVFIASNSTARLWNLAGARTLWSVPEQTRPLSTVAVSPDGRLLLTTDSEAKICLWEAASGKMLRSFGVPGAQTADTGTTAPPPDTATTVSSAARNAVQSVEFSPSGRTVLARIGTPTISYFWSTESGELSCYIEGATRFVPLGDESFALRRRLGGDKTESDLAFAANPARLVDVSRGVTLQQVPEAEDAVSGMQNYGHRLDFCRGGRFLLMAQRDRVGVFDFGAQRIIGSLFTFHDSTWAMVDNAGRYDDGKDGEIPHLHWVLGTADIDLKQLKEHFFEPGLLSKSMGAGHEPLRAVQSLDKVQPAPRVAMEVPPENGHELIIKLQNQGGGIGAVRVYLNGKEYLADARLKRFNATQLLGLSHEPQMTLPVNLTGPLVRAGENNQIRVVAQNADNSIQSRGYESEWHVAGEPYNGPMRFFAIVAGVSDYVDPTLKLNYAAKDARDMMTALQISAQPLFKENTHLTLLIGEKETPPLPAGSLTAQPATKENFQRAFENVAKQAKAQDVFVVYLAGHGASLGLGSNTYCYLTQDANSRNLNAPDREKWTVTSEELAEWTRQIAAKKQVLILDTCAAGAAQDALTRRRSVVSSDQTLAMQRLRDRAGFFVLMGASADDLSYEASRYRQGLLTHALLEGLRGRALKQGKFVEVLEWFKYAQERVPELAQNLNYVQTPQIASPHSESFPIGLLATPAEREKIPLSAAQAQVLRPRVFEADSDDFSDSLNLKPLLREELRKASRDSEASGRGEKTNDKVYGGMSYIDSGELPKAFLPVIQYRIDGEKVRVETTLWREGVEVGKVPPLTTNRNDLPGLARELVTLIRAATATLELSSPTADSAAAVTKKDKK